MHCREQSVSYCRCSYYVTQNLCFVYKCDFCQIMQDLKLYVAHHSVCNDFLHAQTKREKKAFLNVNSTKYAQIIQNLLFCLNYWHFTQKVKKSIGKWLYWGTKEFHKQQQKNVKVQLYMKSCKKGCLFSSTGRMINLSSTWRSCRNHNRWCCFDWTWNGVDHPDPMKADGLRGMCQQYFTNKTFGWGGSFTSESTTKQILRVFNTLYTLVSKMRQLSTNIYILYEAQRGAGGPSSC